MLCELSTQVQVVQHGYIHTGYDASIGRTLAAILVSGQRCHCWFLPIPGKFTGKKMEKTLYSFSQYETLQDFNNGSEE